MKLSLCIVGCGSYARTVLQDIHDLTEDFEFFFALLDGGQEAVVLGHNDSDNRVLGRMDHRSGFTSRDMLSTLDGGLALRKKVEGC